MYVQFGLLTRTFTDITITVFSKYCFRTVSNNKLLDGKL